VLALPADAACVSAARHWSIAVLTLWGLGREDCGTAALVVGELTANAVRYGHRDMSILLLLRPQRLYVCVADSGVVSQDHRPVIPQDPAEHGRGLALVEAVAEAAVAAREPEGWRVGAVLRVGTAGQAARSGAVAL
jgi:anti-sigma regulatory factor (Ser/Thr protein kinase)